MAQVIAFTSSKGGIGKSTLAFNTAGALAARPSAGLVVLVDEDTAIQSCLGWAAAAPVPLPFLVITPDQARTAASSAAVLVIDTEGRPVLADMVALTESAQRVILPCGPSGLEVRATLKLWQALIQAEAEMGRVQVVINKVPPVGTVGQQARDTLRGLGVNVYNTVIRTYAAHQRAAELGMLVKDVPDPRAASAWADIKALAQEISA